MTERLLRDLFCCPRRFSFKSRVWLHPNFGANNRCICHTVHGKDILFSSFLFSWRFPRVCRLQRRESEAVGGVAVVLLWMRRASCGPVPPFSWITGFLLHPTHESRHPTPLPPRLQLWPSEPECSAGRRDVWVNKHQMLQWFQGDFLFRILARMTLACLCI